jgi:chromosome segregation ATPase
MLRSIVPVIALAGLAFSASGCTDCSLDPANRGMFEAAGCIAGGGDAEVEAALQLEIDTTNAYIDELRAENRRLEERAASQSAQRRQLTQRLARLNNETADLNQQISRLYDRGDRSEELNRLREQAQALSEEQIRLGESGNSPREAELSRLEAQREAIKRDIARLLELS